VLLQRPLADVGDLGVVDLDLVDGMRRRGYKAHRECQDASRCPPAIAHDRMLRQIGSRASPRRNSDGQRLTNRHP